MDSLYCSRYLYFAIADFFIQHRSTSLLQGGGDINGPCPCRVQPVGFRPIIWKSDFSGSRGPWQGGRLPVYDQEVYVWVTAKPNGILEVTGVSDKKPTTGDYIFCARNSRR